MYVVSRQDRDGMRDGALVPLESITRFVQLVPKFGSRIDRDVLTPANSMDICRDYYVNSFADKEIFQSVW